jgi:hypothetical protein
MAEKSIGSNERFRLVQSAVATPESGDRRALPRKSHSQSTAEAGTGSRNHRHLAAERHVTAVT